MAECVAQQLDTLDVKELPRQLLFVGFISHTAETVSHLPVV